MARDEGVSFNPKDYLIPGVLFGIGVLIYLVWAFIVAGMPGLAVMGVYLPVRVVIQVVLGVVACFITAKIMGASFGYLTTAIVKLAAIFVFPSAATFFIPYLGWIISLILYWWLLGWLFELETIETVVLAIVIFFVNIAAAIIVVYLGIAMK